MRLLLDPTMTAGGAAPAAAPAAQNPHPAAVQPAPAGVPNPITGQPAAPTINYHIAAPAPAPVPTTQQVAAPAPIPGIMPPTPQTVTIPFEQLQAFTSIQTRLMEMEARQHAEQQAAQTEQARILAQKGEVENALRMLREQSDQTLAAERQRLGQIEDRAKRYALDGEVSRALAAHSLVPGGAEQLSQLWRSQFLVDSQGDSFTVRTPTFQSVGDFVSQQLARPEYAHFVRASTQGGTATGQTTQAAHTPPAQLAAATQPKNMGEAVIMHMRGMQQASGNPQDNMSLGMGLKAIPR
jgi:hypothetical protein